MTPGLLTANADRWFAATRSRISTRKYAGGPTAAELTTLEQTAAACSGDGVRIALLAQAEAVFGHGLLGRASSGVASGAVIALARNAPPWRAGYAGEAFILECTALGLATCWMAATFSKSAARAAASIQPGERIIAATPIGTGADGDIAEIADADRKRKPMAKLIGFDRDHFEGLASWQREAIWCVRRAPSGMNRQPWAVVPGAHWLTLVAKPTAVDTGIAMLHLELGALAAGQVGQWKRLGDGWRFSAVDAVHQAVDPGRWFRKPPGATGLAAGRPAACHRSGR